jgi:hypothetical protein
MRELARRLIARLPLRYRVLYRQFLLRVIDLEALSIEADIPRFLGQFAGVLMMISLMQAVGTLMFPPPPALYWHVEQSAISNMMLVIGLVAVLTWDNTFPDRRDAMILGPLPVRPGTILLAKITASSSLLGISILALNFASSGARSLVFGGAAGWGGIFRYFVSFWFTMVGAAAFLYGSVLTLQGTTAYLLPRRLFLRVSAILQLAAFGVFLVGYFLAPSVDTPAQLGALGNRSPLAASPVLWFFALLNQCNGSLPAGSLWLAQRAWIALAGAIAGAAISLLVCYLRTMRKTVEEPDLVPAAHSFGWMPKLGGSLQSAVLLFILRSLRRSRQHRVVLALFLSVAVSFALHLVREAPRWGATTPVTVDFAMSTLWILIFSVLAFRAVFPLPISLTANWVLRITQLRPPQRYIAAVWRSLLLLAVFPAWLGAVLLSLPYRPFPQAAAHLAVLLVLGFIFADLSLVGFYKIPFTCSYVPGKSNFQLLFWAGLGVFVLLLVFMLQIEYPALHSPRQSGYLLLVLGAAAMVLRIFNHQQAKSAVLYFEEPSPEIIIKLGLLQAQPPAPLVGKP